ncbi:hypothetical protein NDU88_007740 [Pleurodeles waltl]|uniref:Uncharacterized protein n=1 Tax=Pleurodeles waltl TaxID=8319 RepID=A0AAV7STK3_PLEWA|nr:hypothetical protein NDU88_007740 [Pleurodeles waltl]
MAVPSLTKSAHEQLVKGVPGYLILASSFRVQLPGQTPGPGQNVDLYMKITSKRKYCTIGIMPEGQRETPPIFRNKIGQWEVEELWHE